MNRKNWVPLYHQEEKAPTSIKDEFIISPEELVEAQSFMDDIVSAYPPVGTAEDAAELLKMPVTSVRSLCRTGQLNAFKVGKLWRITRAELISFIKEGGC